jgi:hypothetical protein
MDEELRLHLEAMEERLMARMNTQHERLIESTDGLRSDFQATKGFLLEDAIVTGRRLLTIEERLSRLERGQ